jgi:hypothetical protein
MGVLSILYSDAIVESGMMARRIPPMARILLYSGIPTMLGLLYKQIYTAILYLTKIEQRLFYTISKFHRHK